MGFVLHAAAAQAQAVDYGTLEQMFGEPITTSATGKPQRASDVPADMVIVTQDDIRRSGADNIPDILQFISGIDVRHYSFSDAQVAIRGYDLPSNPRMLVLVDGRQVYDDFYGFVEWDRLPIQLAEIRQIEIIKGPNSALFGFNAASGVINIITFDPLLDKTNVATVRGGTQGYGEGEAVATQHFGPNAGVRVSLGGWSTTGYSQAVAAPTPVSRYAAYNVDGRWQVLPWLLLRAAGGYDDVNSASGLPIGLVVSTHGITSYLRAGADAQTRTGTFHADLYRNQSLESFLGTKLDVRLLLAKIDDTVKLDAGNVIRFSIDYRSDAVSSSGVQFFPGTVSYRNIAADAMWNWHISPMFDLTNAVRLDHMELHQSGPLLQTPGRSAHLYNSTTLTEPSFNTGLVIHISDNDTVRLTAARGLQLPSLTDFGGQTEVAPHVYEFGVPGLAPESVWNGELSYDHSLAWLGASLRAAIFFQRNTDILAPSGTTSFAPTGGVVADEAANIGSSNQIGFEIGLRGATPGGVRWNASYRHASITQDISADVPPGQATRFDNGTPRHTIILGAGYTLGKWEMDAAARFQTGFTDYTLNRADILTPVHVPDFVTLNARIGYRLTGRLTLAATAEQFLMSRTLNTATSYVDRRVVASATFHY